MLLWFQKRQACQAKANACYEKWYSEREEQRRQLKLKAKQEAEEKVHIVGLASLHSQCYDLCHNYSTLYMQ